MSDAAVPLGKIVFFLMEAESPGLWQIMAL